MTASEEELLEIEIRYQLEEDDWSQFPRLLAELGFTLVGTSEQADTYYTSLHKDFIETEECLRIRRVKGKSTVTWKPPSSDEMRMASEFWKREIDLDVTAQEDVVSSLFEALDFIEFVTVSKSRSEFRRGDVEIALDRVDRAGTFVELEVKSADLEATRSLLAEVSAELRLDASRVCTVPYRDLVPRESHA